MWNVFYVRQLVKLLEVYPCSVTGVLYGEKSFIPALYSELLSHDHCWIRPILLDSAKQLEFKYMFKIQLTAKKFNNKKLKDLITSAEINVHMHSIQNAYK